MAFIPRQKLSKPDSGIAHLLLGIEKSEEIPSGSGGGKENYPGGGSDSGGGGSDDAAGGGEAASTMYADWPETYVEAG